MGSWTDLDQSSVHGYRVFLKVADRDETWASSTPTSRSWVCPTTRVRSTARERVLARAASATARPFTASPWRRLRPGAGRDVPRRSLAVGRLR